MLKIYSWCRCVCVLGENNNAGPGKDHDYDLCFLEGISRRSLARGPRSVAFVLPLFLNFMVLLKRNRGAAAIISWFLRVVQVGTWVPVSYRRGTGHVVPARPPSAP